MKKENIGWKIGLLVLIVLIIFTYLAFFSVFGNANTKITGLAVGDQGCSEIWNCSRWQPEKCPENKIQARICNDINTCNTTLKKPAENRECEYMPTGFEGNQTRETSIIKFEAVGLVKPDKWKTFIIAMLTIMVSIILGTLAYLIYLWYRNKRMRAININTPAFIKLVGYTKRELEKGFNKKQIKTKLLRDGWGKLTIEKAFLQARYTNINNVYYRRKNDILPRT